MLAMPFMLSPTDTILLLGRQIHADSDMSVSCTERHICQYVIVTGLYVHTMGMYDTGLP